MTVDPTLLQGDSTYRYQLLSRLVSDCHAYLDVENGSANHNPSRLWAGGEVEQVDAMRALWDSFPEGEKPEWTSMEEIEAFEAQMIELEEDASTPSLRPRG